jgi:hypothetical protein
MSLPEMTELSASQIVLRQNEPFDPPSGRNRVNDFGDIRNGHPPIEEVVGLDEDAHSTRALVEATGGAGARGQASQAARLQLFLQRGADLIRTLGRTAAFRVVIRPAINANKEVALAQRHFVRTPRADGNYFE